jgi:hypothetical protein
MVRSMSISCIVHDEVMVCKDFVAEITAQHLAGVICNMKRANSFWALAALCLLVVPASSSSMPDYRGLGYGSGICLMDLSEKDLGSLTAGQLKEIRAQNMEEFGKIFPGHLENLGLEEIKESDNKDLAKLIARRLIKQMEVMQPQASAWLLLTAGLMPELWERVLLSMIILYLEKGFQYSYVFSSLVMSL